MVRNVQNIIFLVYAWQNLVQWPGCTGGTMCSCPVATKYSGSGDDMEENLVRK
jgi:hypothetical protein